jgi:hypothetical protein
MYKDQAKPVEDVFRSKGLLVDFEVTRDRYGTLPLLLKALRPFVPERSVSFREEATGRRKLWAVPTLSDSVK